ncbi:MAG: hypothetical protein VX112_00400 [Pseudomonadota bacterium]|nr:hypothetical protein [Pseudomonadota bacterium]
MKRNHILSLLASTLLASSAVAGGSASVNTMNYDEFKASSLSNKKPGVQVDVSNTMKGITLSASGSSVTEGTLWTFGTSLTHDFGYANVSASYETEKSWENPGSTSDYFTIGLDGKVGAGEVSFKHKGTSDYKSSGSSESANQMSVGMKGVSFTYTNSFMNGDVSEVGYTSGSVKVAYVKGLKTPSINPDETASATDPSDYVGQSLQTAIGDQFVVSYSTKF